MIQSLFCSWNEILTEDDTVAAMERVDQDFGFAGVVCSFSPTGWLPSDEPGPVRRIIQTGMDKDILKGWLQVGDEFYTELSPTNIKFDPIRRQMVKRTLPKRFNFEEMVNEPTTKFTLKEKVWCKQFLKVGITELLSVPAKVPPLEHWALSMMIGENTRKEMLTEENLAGLMYFTHNLVQHCVSKLHWRDSGFDKSDAYLRPRERECIYWAAMGKGAEETAEILNLKIETVRSYIKTALKRLNSRSKAQGVAKAIQLGLLEFDHH